MTVNESYDGIEIGHKKACLFASWDPMGKVDAYVFQYLNDIKKCGFDIYFCTTSESEILKEDLQDLQKICVKIIRRKNIGLDFYSWKTCWDFLPKDVYNELLLTNDSNYGPISGIKKEINKIKNIKADVVSLTDSYEIQYHLQSFFLYFKDKGLKIFLPEFFKSFPKKPTSNKNDFVKQFEIGLTEKMVIDGYDIESLYPYEQIVDTALKLGGDFHYHKKIRERNLNPTAEMWRVLLIHFDYPFLKKELILPKKDIKHLTEEVNFTETLNGNKKIIKLINNHIKRVK